MNSFPSNAIARTEVSEPCPPDSEDKLDGRLVSLFYRQAIFSFRQAVTKPSDDHIGVPQSSVDEVALKQAVTAWACAPDAEKAARFASIEELV